jgi:hypothetical protein
MEKNGLSPAELGTENYCASEGAAAVYQTTRQYELKL